jgi:diguanylate cyclase (GGDEF)-like protein
VPFDLELWREFQEALANLLGIPIALYDGRGNCVASGSGEACVCRQADALKGSKERCHDLYSRAVSEVLEKKQTYIYKCHTNQFVFAVPVFLDKGREYVIMGGGVYLEGDVDKDFHEGLVGFGLDKVHLARLRKEIKTIPGRSIFTLPGIVNNLAVPFLKGLSPPEAPIGPQLKGPAKGPPPAGSGRGPLAGFHALEKVYRSIASVLDREELYETILEKSTELLGAERGSLMILDNKNKVLAVKAAKGIDRSVIKDIRVKVGEGISGSIVAKGIPVMVLDIEDEVPLHKNISRYKTKSFVSIPLKLDDRVIGVINISDKISGEVFSEEDLCLLLSFANYASIALERGAYYSMSEEFKMISMTDPLTGLFNRRYFRERLYEEVERVKRHSECFTTFVIDIDNFKHFNDNYGHVAGDEMLRSVARTIRNAVRSMDVVARYGGEEFTVILPHTNKKESHVIAERIRKEVEKLSRLSTVISEEYTISVGIAEFPLDSNTIDGIIHNADRAMYTAKRLGKNRVVFYES